MTNQNRRKIISTGVNIISNDTKKFNLSTEDLKRQKNILSKLNLAKLPFNISPDRMCALNLEMARHSSAVLKYQEDKTGIKWIFSSIKKYKVFLIIFEQLFYKNILVAC